MIGLGSAVFVPSPVARPSRCFEVPMSESIPSSCLQIVSNARSSGVIELSLAEAEVAAPWSPPPARLDEPGAVDAVSLTPWPRLG